MNLTRGKNDPPVSVFDLMPADVEDIDPLEKTWENLRQIATGTGNGEH